LSRLDSVQRAMPALAEACEAWQQSAEIRIRLADLARTASKIAEETAELKPKPLPPILPANQLSKPSWATCCLLSSTSAAIRRRCGDGLAQLQFTFPPALREMELARHGRSRNCRQTNWKHCGRRPSGSSQPMLPHLNLKSRPSHDSNSLLLRNG